jgi:hypothetical protein
MDPVATIRRVGFRKWYERQLIDSHLCLVTCFLCGIVIATMVEVLGRFEATARYFTQASVMMAALAIGWLAWRRYITVLERAERYGQRSTCATCNTYGRFEVLASGVDTIPGPTAEAVAPLRVEWMRVKCRKCGADWRMPE